MTREAFLGRAEQEQGEGGGHEGWGQQGEHPDGVSGEVAGEEIEVGCEGGRREDEQLEAIEPLGRDFDDLQDAAPEEQPGEDEHEQGDFYRVRLRDQFSIVAFLHVPLSVIFFLYSLVPQLFLSYEFFQLNQKLLLAG